MLASQFSALNFTRFLSTNKLLRCQTMPYEWGKVGSSSCIFQFLQKTTSDLDPTKPYAELWMGNHRSAPSKTESDRTLVEELPGKLFPFLFKILSVGKPLSLQAHPSLEEAKVLHKLQPEHFPDPNHKPEMSLFLKDTLLLYGFRDLENIAENIRNHPELREAIDPRVCKMFLSSHSSDNLKLVVQSLLEKKTKIHFPKNLNSPVKQATDLIHKHFPGDVGVLFPLLLNVVVGKPGESIFIPAGVLHAYLDGDLFEAMAESDNVVRAAMTPKRVDVPTLLKLIKYEATPPKWIKPKVVSKKKYYIPECNEFCLVTLEMREGESETCKFKHPVVGLIYEGEALIGDKIRKEGHIFILSSDDEIHFKAKKGKVHIILCTSQLD